MLPQPQIKYNKENDACTTRTSHGYTSRYAKLVLLELALYDVPVQSTVGLFWF